MKFREHPESKREPAFARSERRGFSEMNQPIGLSSFLKCPPHWAAKDARLGWLLPSLKLGHKDIALPFFWGGMVYKEP